ncbi:MAG: transcription antitermination factor NusB [Planctomycetota bacterium]
MEKKENAIRKRTQARELSFQFLFMLDVRSDDCHDELELFLSEHADDPEVIDFAKGLIQGVIDHQEEIDKTIEKSAQNWELCRIATVDRNIMRQAIFELLFRDDIPPKVSINEAIELGKRFSTANSGGFINGILDRIKRDNNL